MMPMIPRWRLGRILRTRASAIGAAELDAETREQVLAHYDIGPLEGVAAPPGGRRSLSRVVTTPAGRYVLKRYKSSLDAADIHYEHEVVGHLAGTGYPVARLVTTRGGGTLASAGRHHFALFRYVDGFRYTDFYLLSAQRELEYVRGAGRALADLHSRTADLRPAGSKRDGFLPDGSRPWRDDRWYAAEVQRAVASAGSRPMLSGLERFALAQSGRLQNGLAQTAGRVQSHHPQLPKLIVHGDYGPYNLLFNRTGLAAVLDFECARLDLRAGELLFALYRFAGTREGPLDLSRARAFCAGYRSGLRLTPLEIELAPDLLALSCARGIAKAIINASSAGRAGLEGVQRLMRLWDWVSAAPGALRKVVSS